MLRNQSGQGLIEYLIVVALIGVATMGMLRVLNQNLNARFAEVIYTLQGKSKRERSEGVDEKLLHKKDLGDFMNGAAGKDQ